MRKIIIAGNWKMNKTIGQSIELASGLKRELFSVKNLNTDVVICPVFTSLAEVAEIIVDSPIELGAQNLYWEDQGAFTGEISPVMLKDAGCKYVIIGHSERRQFFAETNLTVNKKIIAALNHGLIPIVCVGETLKERDGGQTFKVLNDHITNGVSGISADKMAGIIIAYEPVWAIGTGKTATAEQAQEAHKYIRDLIKDIYSEEVASEVRIQYGGSVKPENISEILLKPDVDGALVGGASLSIESFISIIKKASEVLK
ncbi:MAG: triose-phosphate isomerase [Candidatus Omnitrophota bacterium]|jgi:triosephosphate isomerase|nr:MAG: triose-phosphate isomerase [Candidatus Omnitrophota bacterium]